jgi:hypothetical protein
MIQRTQMALIKTRSVLSGALKQKEVAALELISRQKDPVAWLEKHLRVEAFGSPQLIRVSLSDGDHESLAVIVNAVMDQYLDETQNEARRRLSEVEHVLMRQDNDRDRKTIQYLERARGVYGTDEQQQIARESRSAHAKELRRVQLEKIGVESRLPSRSADEKVDAEAEKDLKQLRVQARSLEDQAKWLNQQIGAIREQPVAVDLLTMKEELETERELAKRLKTYRGEARIDLEDSWISIRQRAE